MKSFFPLSLSLSPFFEGLTGEIRCPVAAVCPLGCKPRREAPWGQGSPPHRAGWSAGLRACCPGPPGFGGPASFLQTRLTTPRHTTPGASSTFSWARQSLCRGAGERSVHGSLQPGAWRRAGRGDHLTPRPRVFPGVAWRLRPPTFPPLRPLPARALPLLLRLCGPRSARRSAPSSGFLAPSCGAGRGQEPASRGVLSCFSQRPAGAGAGCGGSPCRGHRGPATLCGRRLLGPGWASVCLGTGSGSPLAPPVSGRGALSTSLQAMPPERPAGPPASPEYQRCRQAELGSRVLAGG